MTFSLLQNVVTSEEIANHWYQGFSPSNQENMYDNLAEVYENSAALRELTSTGKNGSTIPGNLDNMLQSKQIMCCKNDMHYKMYVDN